MTELLAVDRYVLYEPIAVGGMATVYFARKRGAAGFSQAVAIKRMRPDLVHQREFVDLFLDEARLASRVRHANVVSVIDVVASGEELLLVMEYFHGESLGRLLALAAEKKQKVPPPIAIAIACNVLHGIHAAHEAKGDTGEPLGIVHRDVSPQNIIVGVDGVSRVADFGIARAAGQIHATDEGRTRGKAGYSAPEQLRGGTVTRKIDLFATGAVLWEALVGRRLFEGETQAAIITSVLTDPIEAPGLHIPTLPEALDEVILKALDRDPKRRPENALEMAAALEKAVAPAGPAAVSAWVAELARPDLDKREAIVRRIESGLGTPPSIAKRERPPSMPPLAATDAAGTMGSLATSRSPSVAPPPVPPTGRRGLAAASLGAILLVVVGVTATVVGRGQPAATVNQSVPSASELAVASSPPVTSLVPPSAATASEAAASVASAEPPPVVSSVVAVPSGAPSAKVAPRPTNARPAIPSTKKKGCDPPYDLDSAGRRIFRVQCLD